ncbi:Transglutaminase-like superfamily protein [Paenibacillus sp. UNCCL117]|uniref:transglutaminase-like domain-containing protein n=1 Tax=unclassified Paenibacillus TaxID=185978 RepID=UPI00087E69B9|nr:MULTISPECIES: transglutaminase-like domain-containing protein [unclassified Paenibacillus]SDD63550.1 Transglutaminase-like superfamily protein [Paenibacillus sp. cl123]SFW58500.1 Transglutaminase-like superfamily protein [Paenibacillus sp. UNCCL117]
MRQWMRAGLAVCLMTAYLPAAAWAAKADSASWLDAGKLEQGAFGIVYESAAAAKTKLMVSKDGVNYTYDLAGDGEEEYFPLQLDNGTYKISILQQVTGNKYKPVHSDMLELDMQDKSDVYLHSIQNVNWHEAQTVTDKALELTKDLKTEREKAEAIYSYIASNLVYDYELAASVQTGYIPDLDQVLAVQKGICYDYASLFAAMNRSLGIPTKLLMGESKNVKEYHAWNEILIDGEWLTVDTTVDAGTGSRTFAKNAGDYKASKVY